jgi:hypothetical protein
VNTVKRNLISILVALVLLLGMMGIPSQAATEDEIGQSIQDGLDWLVPQQNLDGSWGTWDKVARTGFAVVKLEDRAFELGYDSPFDPAYVYSAAVTAGLDYIFSQAGSYGPGTGICFDKFGQETYSTGIAMMAIAASRTPGRMVASGPYEEQTYMQVLQANVDYFAWSQNPDGGWIYRWQPSPWGSDNSCTGYAVLGLRYAEDFGCVVPPSVKAGLTNWINFIQCDVPGPDFGGSGYGWPCQMVNLLKTGNLLFEMAFLGLTTNDQSVQDAISYIENHWDDANSDPGWKGPPAGHPHYQSAYCLMKGLESMGVDTITVGASDIDWFDEMSTAIVDSQNVDGSWPVDMWGDSMLSTEWALLTLEKVIPNQPPDCSEAYADPACLWPPNHKFVNVGIMGVTDPDDDPVTITVTAITSDEPTATDEGSGGKKHSPDASGIGTDTTSVRAERSENGDGRVYVIHFMASDDRGGECEGSIIVNVPHDQSDKSCPAVDSGQNYDATQLN